MTERSVVMEGSLDEFDLVSVVQTVSIGRQSTGIELRDDHGAVVGTLLLKAGQIVTAHAEGASGVEAVRRLLRTSRLRRFYVYRASAGELRERIGPVTQVLASILTQSAPPPAEGPPMLMQGSLAQYDLRMVAEAVSLGRQAVGIEIFAPDGRRVGALYLKGGHILFAAWGRSAGEAALSELFKPRKSGRFVVFRSPHARIGEPIAKLADVLYPRPKTDSVIIDVEPPISGEVDADDTQITRVAPAPTETPNASKANGQAVTPPPPSSRPAARPSVPPGASRPSVQPPPIPGKVAPPVPTKPTAKAQASDLPTVIPDTYPAVAASRPPSAPSSATSAQRSAPPPTRAPSVVPDAPVKPVSAAAAKPAGERTSTVSAPPTPSKSPSAAPAARPSAPVSATFSAPPKDPTPAPVAVAQPARPSSASVPTKVDEPVAARAPSPSQAPAAPRFRRSEAPSAAPAQSLLDEPPKATPTAPPRTPILCITSPKGGSGRTTVTLNLAVTLARRGKRVVMVDADQNGLLLALNASSTARAGVADVLTGASTLEAALVKTRMPGLSLLPSGELGGELFTHAGWQPLLASLAAQADVVLIDCAASLYGATPAALINATHQLTVIAAEPAAQRVYGAYRARLQKQRIDTPNIGIVLNMLDYQARASVRALEELCASEYAREVLDVTIPRSPAFMEASERGLPIVHAEQGASSAIGWLFETLASALFERLQIESPVFAQPLLA